MRKIIGPILAALLIGAVVLSVPVQPARLQAAQPPTLDHPSSMVSDEGGTIDFTINCQHGSSPLTYSGTLPSGITVSWDSSHSNHCHVTGTLGSHAANGWAGEASVTVVDHDGATDKATWSWTIHDHTVPTSSGLPNRSSNEGQAVNVNLGTLVTDSDGDTLTLSALGLPPSLTMSASGQITGTVGPQAFQTAPGPGAGVYPVQVTASDGVNSATFSFNWTISDVSAPTWTLSDRTDNELAVIDEWVNTASDSDGDTLHYSAFNMPGGLTLSDNGHLIGTLGNWSGVLHVHWMVSDGANTTDAWFWWTITDNTTPEITGPHARTVPDGVAPPTLSATDADGDTGLLFTRQPGGSLPPGVTFNANGTFSGSAPHSAVGSSYTATYTASDGNNVSAPFELTLTIADNTTPSLGTLPALTNNELDVIDSTTVFAATDADGDTLTYSATGLPPGLALEPTGRLHGTIGGQARGTYTVSVSACDGINTGTGSCSWTVSDTTAPHWAAVVDLTLDELQVVDAWFGSLVDDHDGDPLTFSAAGLPSGLSMGTDGHLTGTISGQAVGVYPVSLWASDGTYSTQATFTLTVHDHTVPALTSPASQAVAEGSAPAALTASDSDGDTAFTFARDPGYGSLPPGVTFDTNGSFSGAAAHANVGSSYSSRFTVSDGFNTSPPFEITFTVSDTTVPSWSLSDRASDELAVIDERIAATDADDDTLTYGGLDLPPGLSLSTGGHLTGTIAGNAAGRYHVSYTAFDGFNLGTGWFWWTINDITTPEITSPHAVSVCEGATPPALTAADADGDTGLIFYRDPAYGALPPGVSFNADGTFSGGPTHAAAGESYTSRYTVQDAAGNESGWFIQTFNISDDTVPSFGALPNLTNDEGDVIESSAIFAATDADGDPLIYAATGLPTGLTLESDGRLHGTIGGQAVGVYHVSVSACDGINLGTGTCDWTIHDHTVPAFTCSSSVSVIEGTTPPALTATDADGDPLTFTIDPAHNQILPGLTFHPDGTFTGTTGHFLGTWYSRYRVSDGTNTSDWFQLAMTGVDNTTPVWGTLPLRGNNELDHFDYVFEAGDADHDPLFYSASGLPPGLSIVGTGRVSGTIAGNAAGSYTVTLTASDGANEASTTFTWNVADVTTPSITSGSSQTVIEGSAPAALAATDADGDAPLVFTRDTSYGSLPPGVTFNPDGTFGGAATHAGAGQTFTSRYTVTDGFNVSSPFDLSITVSDNTTPAFPAGIPAHESDELEPVNTWLNLAADTDGDTLTYSATGLPPGLTMGTDGHVTGTVAGTAVGSHTVTLTAVDGINGVSTPFTWTIHDHTVPAFTCLSTQTVIEGSGPAALAAADADSDPLTFARDASFGSLPPGISFNANGTFSGTAGHAAAGATYPSRYTVTDGTNTSAPFEVAISVVDDTTPAFTSAAANTAQTVAEGATAGGPGWLAALVATDGDGDTLTYTLTAGSGPLPAGVTLDADGTFAGTVGPQATQTGAGVYEVTVRVTDGLSSSTTALAITVDDPTTPAFTDDPTNTEQWVDEGASDTGAGWLAPLEAADADDDGLVYGPAAGTAAGSLPPGVSFNPDGSFSGTVGGQARGDWVSTYTVTDGHTTSPEITLTIHCREVTTPAFTADQTNTAQTVAEGAGPGVPGYLAPLTAADADGDALTFALAAGSGPLPAGVTLNADGAFSGTPGNQAAQGGSAGGSGGGGGGGAGVYAVTVEVSDGVLKSTASLTITVTDPTPPIFTGAAANTAQTVEVGAAAGSPGWLKPVVAADADGDPLTYSLASGKLPPGVSLAATGAFTGHVTASGAFTAVIRVSDGVNQAETTLRVKVPEVEEDEADGGSGPTAPRLGPPLKEGVVITLSLDSGRVLINGYPFESDTRPYLSPAGRAMVPIRLIAEALGAAVWWNPLTGAVTIRGDWTEIVLVPGSTTALVNGVAVTLDSAPQIREGRLYVPVRFVAEALGAEVSFDPATRTVRIER